MNKKIVSILALIVVFSLSFFYLNHNFLSANDKDRKTCSNESACDDKNNQVKAGGGEYESYEFVTDQACCDEMKNALQTELLTVAGVKEVKFGLSCSVSKMTNVTVMYAAGETTAENIAAYLKDKNYDCSGKSCTEDGVKSGETHKEGCDTKKECPGKDKKSTDSKQL
jgi:hypothetical protein